MTASWVIWISEPARSPAGGSVRELVSGPARGAGGRHPGMLGRHRAQPDAQGHHPAEISTGPGWPERHQGRTMTDHPGNTGATPKCLTSIGRPAPANAQHLATQTKTPQVSSLPLPQILWHRTAGKRPAPPRASATATTRMILDTTTGPLPLPHGNGPARSAGDLGYVAPRRAQ